MHLEGRSDVLHMGVDCKIVEAIWGSISKPAGYVHRFVVPAEPGRKCLWQPSNGGQAMKNYAVDASPRKNMQCPSIPSCFFFEAL